MKSDSNRKEERTEAKREKENNQRIQTKKYKWGDTERKKEQSQWGKEDRRERQKPTRRLRQGKKRDGAKKGCMPDTWHQVQYVATGRDRQTGMQTHRKQNHRRKA